MTKFKAELMDADAVRRSLSRIAHEIIEKNQGTADLRIVGIRRRGAVLADIIAENIKKFENTEVPCGSIDITFYRDDLSRIDETPVTHGTDIPFDVNGKKIIIVDDVLYTGRTARAAIDGIFSRGRPSCIQLAVLIDRGHRELPIRADYAGKNVPTSRNEHIAVHVPVYDNISNVELYEKA